jgi:2-polyprenyl-3-methyl-5-hydroxy-6-metoxy-1,4-benzoquinol methylase
MNEQEILQKVNSLLNSVHSVPELALEIEYLKVRLSISDEQVRGSWIFWDTKKREYSNEVYSSQALRLVMHLHNYLQGSWHEKRQKVVLEYLQSLSAKRICDIGFGTPQRYVHQFLSREDAQIMLADFEDSSLSFASAVLDYWNKHWQHKINLQLFDLNRDDLPEGFDTYLFQDSIEHADDPSKTLRRYVEILPKGTRLIFSLPIEIENPVPEHHIYWNSESGIVRWLKCAGLSVERYQVIEMNPDIDLFSLFLHPEFREIVVLARV